MEIQDADALSRLLRSGAPVSGVRLQDVDLTGAVDELTARTDLTGLVVMGGRADPGLLAGLVRRGAVVLPAAPDAPVDVYRATLYSPEELYAGLEGGYEQTPDARAYAWSQDVSLGDDAYVAALRALHDSAVTDALDEAVAGHRVVGVMGGHDLSRADRGYAEAALLGHALARAGMVVATGGGPGAMEAANLGAAAPSRDHLEQALLRLVQVPEPAPSVARWAQAALEARAGWPRTPLTSLGVPTWFYGHEPPNVFAQEVAKLFSNAVREDLLLARCDAGVVVLPGAAGTVQEVFQLATRLYYAPAGRTVPLVLVGREHWTRVLPVWPVLTLLAQGREMAARLRLVDDVREAAQALHDAS